MKVLSQKDIARVSGGEGPDNKLMLPTIYAFGWNLSSFGTTVGFSYGGASGTGLAVGMTSPIPVQGLPGVLWGQDAIFWSIQGYAGPDPADRSAWTEEQVDFVESLEQQYPEQTELVEFRVDDKGNLHAVANAMVFLDSIEPALDEYNYGEDVIFGGQSVSPPLLPNPVDLGASQAAFKSIIESVEPFSPGMV